MKELKDLFFAGWEVISPRGRQVLTLYTLGLILVSGLDALALYLVSKSFSNEDDYSSKESVIAGMVIASLFVAKSILSAAISYVSILAFAKEESRIATSNLHKIDEKPWLDRLQETNSYLQNSIDRGPYLLTQSNLLGVCTVVAEGFSALAIVVSIMILQPSTALSLVLYFVAVVLLQYRVLSKISTRLGNQVLHLTNLVYDYISDLHSLAKVLSVMPSKTFIREISGHRTSLARARGLQIFVSNIPRYFLEVVLVLGVVIVGSISYIFSGEKGVISAITLFSIAGFRLLPIVNRIQVLIFAMLGSAPISRSALLTSRSTLEFQDQLELSNKKSLAVNELMRLENVSFAYPSQSTFAISDVTFSIEKKKQYAIVGLSGSGKTTLVDLMLGLISPTSGILTRDNASQHKIGYVPQDSILTAGSIAQNVSLEWELSDVPLNKVQSALDDAKADESSIGISINGIISSSLSLSGGQRQRIGIARALYRDCNLIVLDEATSALDAITEREIMKTMDELKETCATVIIAHRLATVEHVDEVIYMHNGKILGIGKFEDLRKSIPSFSAQIQAGLLSTEK